MAEFMTGLKRTDYCGKLRADDIGKKMLLSLAGFRDSVIKVTSYS